MRDNSAKKFKNAWRKSNLRWILGNIPSIRWNSTRMSNFSEDTSE